jgi:nucleotide-binding universal stress UspA family protein
MLVHVGQRFLIGHPMGAEMTRQTYVPPIKQAAANLERMAEDLSKSSGVEVSISIRDGTPFEEICRVSKTLRADLIVLTPHGYTGLKHVWLGSTAERVVRHAYCPLLVVRELNNQLSQNQHFSSVELPFLRRLTAFKVSEIIFRKTFSHG